MDEKNNALTSTNNEVTTISIDEKSLEESSKDIINRIISENNIDKLKDLSKEFNVNQVKKNLVKTTKANKLYDDVIDQVLKRVEQRPDEMTSKELIDLINASQTIIEKSQKSIETLDTNPIVQINNQEINIGVNDNKLDRESKERVLSIVQKILSCAQSSEQPEIKEPEFVDTNKEESGNGNQ